MQGQPAHGKKAPRGAFFVLAVLLGWLAGVAQADCKLDGAFGKPQAVKVAQVLDGDTVELVDGRRVRLVGINTPELAHPPRPEEPLAQWAADLLRDRIGDRPLWLQPGQQAKDHYGRTLGYLFTAEGNNIIAELLYSGAGFQVAIPPNLAYGDCYTAAQAQARVQGRGVWGHPYFDPLPADSPVLKSGYVRVVGRVEKVSLTRNVIWVDLQGQVTLKLNRKHAKFLAGDTFDQVVAASRKRSGITDLVLEARGWVVDRNTWGERMVQQIKAGKRKPFQMNVQHASSWELVSADGQSVPGRQPAPESATM